MALTGRGIPSQRLGRSRLSLADYDARYFAGARHLHLSGVAPADFARPRWNSPLTSQAKHASSIQRITFDPNLRPVLWPERE